MNRRLRPIFKILELHPGLDHLIVTGQFLAQELPVGALAPP
jgi:hypothetical protein